MAALLEKQDPRDPDASLAVVRALPRTPDDDVIDLRYLVVTWLKWLWVPVILSLVGAYMGYRDLQGFRPQSVATMTVLPASTGGGTASTGRVESLAAQFGIQLGPQSTEVSPFYRLRIILGSVLLAQRLQEKYGLLQRAYPGAWDPVAGVWRRPEGEDFERDQRRRALLRQNLWMAPNLETLADYVSGKLKITRVEGGTLEQISVEDPDPEYALWLLTTVYFEADDLLREQDRRDMADRVAYINREMAATTNFQIQEGLRGMLATELNRGVTLASNLPYAAKVTEPARVMNRRTEPNLRRIFVVPIALASAVGFFLITLLAVFRRERRAI